jgi:predicted neutral ceramidase superfamily lipid hydrolase
MSTENETNTNAKTQTTIDNQNKTNEKKAHESTEKSKTESKTIENERKTLPFAGISVGFDFSEYGFKLQTDSSAIGETKDISSSSLQKVRIFP